MSIISSDEIENYDEFREFETNYVGNKTTMLDKSDDWYYSDINFVTNSHLKILGSKGPKHLLDYYKNGGTDSSAFSFGRAAHCFILEPDEFSKRYLVVDDTDIKNEIGGARPTATKAYKEWLNLIEEEALTDNKELLNIDDWNTILAMKSELDKIKEFKDLMTGTLKEKIFTNEFVGVRVKIKLDAINTGNYVIDYKTTNDAATRENFIRDMYKYGYDHQAAFYCDVTGTNRFIFIVQEKSFPYSIMIAELSDDVLEKGRAKYQRNLLAYKKYFIDNDPEDILKTYYLKTTI